MSENTSVNTSELSSEKKKQLEELASRSELQIANKTAMLTLTIICTILSLAYILEVFKGARTAGYIVITVILAMAPVLIGWIVYRTNNESKAILHIVGCGYGLLYIFLLFTAQNALVFTYAIPMLIVVTLYNNRVMTVVLGSSVCLLNLISAIVQILQAEDAKGLLATLEIQVLVMLLIVIYLIMVSNGTARFQDIRMARLSLQENKTNKLLQDILNISGHMSETIASVSTEMNSLQESVDRTVDSMEEVTGGTGESADAVQHQLLKTEEIQQHIVDVEDAAKVIEENIQTTGDAVAKGREHISEMNTYTAQVDRAGKDVAAALEIFKETTSKMNTITDLITNVASETSLLALNASIEAARAGDAGRGFAVVASEISGLAGQTTEATDNIVSLIANISSQVDTMVNTIDTLIKTGAEESRCAEQTSESFTTIADNVSVIRDHSSQLALAVRNLAAANKEIVDSIQTISAITEEVTAHASETHDASEQNRNIVRHINTMVASLSSDAGELHART